MTGQPKRQEIIIQIDTVDQIFNAPDIDPFSDRDVDVLGEAAILRAVREFQSGGVRPSRWARLIIKLPPDQITHDLQPQLVAAVRRFCTAKIKDNRLQIRLSRVQSLIGLLLALVILLAVGAAGYILLLPALSNASQVIQGIVIGFFSVFAWVIMWDPMEKLLFDWVSPFLENRILRRMMDLDIVVEAQS
jgi:hypothetical protein